MAGIRRLADTRRGGCGPSGYVESRLLGKTAGASRPGRHDRL